MRNPCPYCNSSSGYKEFDTTTYCFKCHIWTPKSISGLYSYPKDDYRSIKPEYKVEYSLSKFHPEALEWLYKYYIFDSDIKKYKIGYIPNLHRLFFSFFNKGYLEYYITRALLVDDIKYNTPKGIKPPLWYIQQNGNTIVIVEDYISTIRVGKQYSCLWCQGTYMNKTMIEYVTSKYRNIILWFDGDDAGISANKRSIIDIRSFENNTLKNRMYTRPNEENKVKILSIFTKNDPKCYTDSEISVIINNNSKDKA